MSNDATDFVTAGTRNLKNFSPEPPAVPNVTPGDTSEAVLPGSFANSPLAALMNNGQSGGSHIPSFEEQVPNQPRTPTVTTGQELPTPRTSDDAQYVRTMSPEMPNPEMTIPEGTAVAVPDAENFARQAAQLFNGTQDTFPCFTVLNMEQGALTPFTKEYTNALNLTNCVAEIPMLLDYMVRLEREFGVTLPFKACGIDTIVFDNAAVQQQDGPSTVQISVGEGDEKSDRFYEKISVDGVVYLSCINESLNPEYLHRIISEAVDSVYIHRHYVYTLVGPRPLNNRFVKVKDEAGEDINKQEFIETMKLNSYELSVFINYMNSIDGVRVVHGTYDGHAAIMFQR